MSTQTVMLEIKADATGAVTGVKVVKRSMEDLQVAAENTGKAAAKGLSPLRTCLQDLAANSNSLFRALDKLKTVGIPVVGFAAMAKEILQSGLALEKFQAQFKAATGSTALATAELAFIRGEADRLALKIGDLSGSYAMFLNSVRGTSLEGSSARKAFIGIAEGMAAMKLPGEAAVRVFAQVQQMAGKPKVELEDLKTMAEAGLPAFKLLADAVGGQAVLNERLKAGTMGGVEAVRLLGASLHQVFGGDAIKATESAQGAINRFSNTLTRAKEEMAAWALPGVTASLKSIVEHAGQIKAALEAVAVAVVSALVGRVGTALVAFGASMMTATTYTRGLMGEMIATTTAGVGLSRALAAVGTAVKTAFTTMGGWIGLVTLALTEAYLWWGRYKESKDKAMAAANKAPDSLTALRDEVDLLKKRAKLLAEGVPKSQQGSDAELTDKANLERQLAEWQRYDVFSPGEIARKAAAIAKIKEQLAEYTRLHQEAAGPLKVLNDEEEKRRKNEAAAGAPKEKKGADDLKRQAAEADAYRKAVEGIETKILELDPALDQYARKNIEIDATIKELLRTNPQHAASLEELRRRYYAATDAADAHKKSLEQQGVMTKATEELRKYTDALEQLSMSEAERAAAKIDETYRPALDQAHLLRMSAVTPEQKAVADDSISKITALKDAEKDRFAQQQQFAVREAEINLRKTQGYDDEATRLQSLLTLDKMRFDGKAPELLQIEQMIQKTRELQAAREAEQALADKQTGTAIIAEADPNMKRLKAMQAANQKEIADEKAKHKELLNIRDSANVLTAEMRKKNDAELAASSDRIAALDSENTRNTTAAKLGMISDYAGGAANLFATLADAQDQSSKSGFESAKAYNIAAAVMSTAAGIMKAYELGPIAGTVAAVMVAATGAIQIAKIAATTFGGGASAPTAAAGSYSVGSSGAGGAITGSAIGNPYNTLHDTQSYASLKRLADASDKAGLAIGKVADGMTNIADMFKTGTMAGNISKQAPGYGSVIQNIDGSNGGFAANATRFGVGYLGGAAAGTMIMPGIGTAIGALVGGIMAAASRGPWLRQLGGINLGMEGGAMTGSGWAVYGSKGGWFSGTKNKEIPENTVSQEFLNALTLQTDQIKSTLNYAAVAMGTTVDFTKAQAVSARITTTGKSSDEINKEIKALFENISGSLAQTMDGLQQFTYYGENAFDAAVRLSTALQSTNEGLDQIGVKMLASGPNGTSTIADANRAYKLQDLMGGADKFATTLKDYVSAMYTAEEQAALKAKTATDQVTAAFGEMNVAVPASKAAFAAIVQSLDVSTERGAQLFDALMKVSGAFATIIDQADKLNKLKTESQQDLKVRTLRVKGLTAEADMMALIYQQQAELLDYQTKGLDVTALRIVQEQEFQAALQESAKNIGQVMQALQTQISGQLSVLQVVQGWNTSEATLTPLQRLENTRTAYLTDFADAQLGSDGAKLTDLEKAKQEAGLANVGGTAQAYLDAARNYYGGGGQYLTILDQLKTDLAITLGGAKTTDVTGVAAQISWLSAIKQAITDGNKDTYDKLTAVNQTGITGNTAMASYTNAVNTFITSIKTAREQESAIAANKLAFADIVTQRAPALASYNNAVGAVSAEQKRYDNALSTDITNTGSLAYAKEQLRLEQERYNQFAGKQKYYASLGLGDNWFGTKDKAAASEKLIKETWEPAIANLEAIATGTELARLKKLVGPLETTLYTLNGYGRSYWDFLHNAGVPGYEAATPGFAVGSPYIPHDMLANIHQGEMILDRRSADVLRQYGIPTTGAADNRETVAELKESNKKMAATVERLEAVITVLQAGFNGLLTQGEEQTAETRDLVQQQRLKVAA